MKCRSIYLRHFSMHRNTTSYTKLRRLSCVDLRTQGLCGWLRGTLNFKGIGETTSTSWGFYPGRIYGIPKHVVCQWKYSFVSVKTQFMSHLWSGLQSQFEGEKLKGKGRLRKVKGNYYLVDVYRSVHILISFSSYCIY